jgi:hypothetical protein
MADQRLVDYVRDSLQNGATEEELTEILANQGWNLNDINEAINIVQGYSQAPPIPQQQEAQTQLPAAKTVQPAQPSAKPRRPMAVTIICVLGFLGSILLLVGGILYVALGQFLAELIPISGAIPFLGNQTGADAGGVLSFFGLISGFLGILIIVIALAAFAGFFLLWKMKKMGLIIIAVLGMLSIIYALMGYNADNVISLAAEVAVVGVVIGYLFVKRHVFV